MTKTYLVARSGDAMLHGLLLHLLPILHPTRSGRGRVQRRLKGGCGGLRHRQGGGEGGEDGGVNLFAGDVNNQRAGGEALADIVEGFAGIGASVFGEDLSDEEGVGLTRGFVLEVLAWLDLFLVVQPDDVVLLCATWWGVSVRT